MQLLAYSVHIESCPRTLVYSLPVKCLCQYMALLIAILTFLIMLGMLELLTANNVYVAI